MINCMIYIWRNTRIFKTNLIPSSSQEGLLSDFQLLPSPFLLLVGFLVLLAFVMKCKICIIWNFFGYSLWLIYLINKIWSPKITRMQDACYGHTYNLKLKFRNAFNSYHSINLIIVTKKTEVKQTHNI